MKREEPARTPLVKRFIGGVYKTSHKFSEFVARFNRTREESFEVVVYEMEVVI